MEELKIIKEEGAKFLLKLIKNLETGKMGNGGDSAENTATFTSNDVTSPTAWTNIDVLKSGEKHSSIFNKVSTMFKNVRYLWKVLGSTDISSIGDGTVTGAISSQNKAFTNSIDELNANLNGKASTTHNHTKSQITDFPTSMPASDVPDWAKATSKPSYSWSEITSKPNTFTPSSHAHDYADTAHGLRTYGEGGSSHGTSFILKCKFNHFSDSRFGLYTDNYGIRVDCATLANTANAVAWANVSGKPSTYTPESHTHSYLSLAGGTMCGDIIMQTGYKVLWGTGGGIKCDGNQRLFLFASNETDYMLFLGVANNKWTLCPGVDAHLYLGTPNYKWQQIYSESSNISTSDRNLKDNIKPLEDVYYQFFLKLIPVSFTFNNGESGRTHIGFISQDVEETMNELGMTSLDFAGFCKDVKTVSIMKDNKLIEEPVLDENGNPEYIYSLRYAEFISIITDALQRTIRRLDDIEERLVNLESS